MDPFKYDVFISYSRKDTPVADKICKAFDEAGITYFIDRQGIAGGLEFPAVLARAIRESRVFLFLASKNSYESKFTQSEVIYAFNKKKKHDIIPYIIDDSELPEDLAFTFSAINWRTLKYHPIDPVLVNDVLSKLPPQEKKEVVKEETEKLKKSETHENLPHHEQKRIKVNSSYSIDDRIIAVKGTSIDKYTLAALIVLSLGFVFRFLALLFGSLQIRFPHIILTFAQDILLLGLFCKEFFYIGVESRFRIPFILCILGFGVLLASSPILIWVDSFNNILRIVMSINDILLIVALCWMMRLYVKEFNRKAACFILAIYFIVDFFVRCFLFYRLNSEVLFGIYLRNSFILILFYLLFVFLFSRQSRIE